MAVTEIYVDPSIAGDSGAGTIGDPYGDLEYAIEQTTFDTSNGTRVNIKAGTDEVLAANLATAFADTGTSVAWVPVKAGPHAIFQGYTSAADDGGKGGISGGGSVPVFESGTLDGVQFIDLHLHNCGANYIIAGDDGCSVIACELDNATGNRAVDLDEDAYVADNYIHNVSDFGVVILSGVIERNIIIVGTNKFTFGIRADGSDPCIIRKNIISVDGTGTGIDADNTAWIDDNSIYSAGGSGTGILLAAISFCRSITNNVVEGFSSSGTGIDVDLSTAVLLRYGGNAVYDCATAYTTPVRNYSSLGDNETLTASPFTDAANGNFSPVDTGNVKEGSLPAAFYV